MLLQYAKLYSIATFQCQIILRDERIKALALHTEQITATEVLKSLPNDIWDSYGASWWGPDGKHAFMEFDYRGVLGAKIKYPDMATRFTALSREGQVSDCSVPWNICSPNNRKFS